MMEEYAGIVEAVLLLEVEPIDEAMIARITKLSREEVDNALNRLVERYSEDQFGIMPMRIAGGWALSPKEYLRDKLKGRYGKLREDRLSRAGLETLAIIAYSQPLTRSEIENLRGVNVDGMIRVLKEKELIKEVAYKESPGRPALYGTTKKFLKVFRLSSISDLPKLDELDAQKFAVSETVRDE